MEHFTITVNLSSSHKTECPDTGGAHPTKQIYFEGVWVEKDCYMAAVELQVESEFVKFSMYMFITAVNPSGTTK